MTPQQQQQYIHPPPQAPSPAQNGQPMTPQQQHAQRQQMQAAHAQAQVMHQRANQSLAEFQAQAQQTQAQQMNAARQQSQGPGQGQPQGQNPEGLTHHQQLQAMQAQQLQIATNQMYAGLGLGQVVPGVMASAAADLGLQGRDINSMNEEERVSLVDLCFRIALTFQAPFEP
jgi:hypothetical protein